MRIRHLMLLILYAAIAIALAIPAVRARGSDRARVLLTSLSIGIAWVLASLSWLILRPGPHRDWVTAFLFWLSFTVATPCWIVESFTRIGRSDRVFSVVMTLQCAYCSVWIARRFLIPC